MKRTTAFLAFIALATMAAAQTPDKAPPAPPEDLKAPPSDAVRSESGLRSKVLTAGTSRERPSGTDVVTVHYTGWASDGLVIDSSVSRGAPSSFPLSRAMAGYGECVQLMVLGEKRRCWIPQDLAYRGQAGRPTGTIVFDIELLDTRRSPTIAPPDVKEAPTDAKRTESGLAYTVLRPGTGTEHPMAYSRVTVHYTGWTTDGKMFDSSVTRGMPATLSLDRVIPGWTEGLQLMVEGERARFWIPENLAYKGQAGAPAGMLVFEIDLVRIE